MKKILKVLGGIVGVIVLGVLVLLTYITVGEYQPKDVEKLTVIDGKRQISMTDTLDITTWNIGYAGLGSTEDFFMDGGKNVEPASKEMITNNLKHISKELQKESADIYLLQEVDTESKRSYKVDQQEFLESALSQTSVFAYNFKVNFVPFPIPPIGKVESGLLTMTDYEMSEAKRVALPNPFSWPVRTSNLKRFLLETRFPIEHSDKELVVFNLHLEAYDL